MWLSPLFPLVLSSLYNRKIRTTLALLKSEKSFYSFTGRWKVNSLPFPGSLSTLMLPPWNDAISFTIDSPRPVPEPVRELSA